ncbi:hypothetical protein C4579_04130 [Candidatus Microgenomates bacterium]|nr:MAG: hypothetical protein C4579_04130 [Candidatus Microgenomates bacterium]
MKISTIQILKTVIYADIHDFALKKNELWQYLIGRHIKYTTFTSELERLVRSKQLHQVSEYYSLSKRKNLISYRRRLVKSQTTKLHLAHQAAHVLTYIPTLWYVGVSGSLAIENARMDDDIDLFLICAPHTVWITRLLCVLLLEFFGNRRTARSRNAQDLLCANMFMDASLLKLPKKEQDLYSAHEIAQVKTLFSKHGSYERFLQANSWVRTFLPHTYIPTQRIDKLQPAPLWRTFLNAVLFYAQKRYMRARLTTEIVEPNQIRFHPQDARSWVLPAFRARTKALGMK